MKRILGLAVVVALFMLTACADNDYYSGNYNNDYNCTDDYSVDKVCDSDCCYDCNRDCEHDCCDDDCATCETPRSSEYFTPNIGYAPSEHPIIGQWRFVGIISLSDGEFIPMEYGHRYVFLPGGEGFIGWSVEPMLISWSIDDVVLTMSRADEPWEGWQYQYNILGNQLTLSGGPPCQEPQVFERIED